jgi:hypothetical protein
MRSAAYVLALGLLAIAMVLFAITISKAGGPWSDQYCDIKTETTIVKNVKGEIIEQNTVEKVICEDGAMDFLHGAKIAKNCKIFTWKMPLGQTYVDQRSISCKRMDGSYEIVPGYHSVE